MIIIAGLASQSEMVTRIAAAVASAGLLGRAYTSSLDEINNLSCASILVTLGAICGAREFEKMPHLRAIVSPVLGYEWIDVAAATRRGIAVVNGEASEHRESMAEATIMLLLVLLYRLHDTQELARSDRSSHGLNRHMLKGRRVGIIGFGGIAKELIRRLAHWGCEIVVSTRGPATDRPDVRFVALDDLIATSDIVLVMTRSEPATYHLLSQDRLQRMKSGALLINTSRGGIVDEMALVEQLRSGRIAAAALDVFEVEPLPLEHPLRELSNVVLTPHAIGHTMEGHGAIVRETVNNILALLSGHLPGSCKNREVESQWTGARSGKCTSPR